MGKFLTINSETGGWDITTVKEIFIPYDVEVILNIPISPCLSDDTQVWARTQSGNFTVRSAYHVARTWLLEGNHKADKGSASNSKKMKEPGGPFGACSVKIE